MQWDKFGSKYLLRLDKGEEIVQEIMKFCSKRKIRSGWVCGIGAVSKASIGLFNAETKEYRSLNLAGDYEITGLTGNISMKDKEIYLHVHITLSDLDHTYGGHLNEAVVSATAEIMVEPFDGMVEREFNEEIGLNLLKLI